MHQASSLKRKFIALLTVFLTFASAGCSRKPADTLSMEEWIHSICLNSGIEGYSQKTPYYLNVSETSAYYDDIQAAVEYGVLSDSYAFDPEQKLSRELAAYTLMNLSGKKDIQQSSRINDISDSEYRTFIESAVSSGLMHTDKRKCFYPKRLMDKTEADILLKQVVEYINNRKFEISESKVDFNEDLQFVEETPIQFDEESMKASFSTESRLIEGDYVHWKNGSEDLYYQIESLHNADNQKDAVLSEIPLEEILTSLDIQSSSQIDFTEAEIEIESADYLESEPTVFYGGMGIRNMSVSALQKTVKFNGFNLTFKTTASGFKADVYKDMKYGGRFYASVNLYNVKPSYKWKIKDGRIEEGYFKVDFKTNQSIGMRTGIYKNLYGDFSRIDPNSFLNTLKNLYQNKNDTVEISIPLCTIKVPLPEMPIMKLEMQLHLKINASGKAELSLTQDHSYGMEIRNNTLRMVKNFDNKSNHTIKADTGLLAGITFGLNMENLKLADIGIDAGAKASIAAAVHIYDEKGSMHTVASELPADLLDEMSSGNGDIAVCADMKAYWILNLIMNSSKTLAGRLHLSKKIKILNADNAPLISGMKTHLENWMFVDACTKNKRPSSIDHSLPKTTMIRIADYSLIMNKTESKTIQVIGLPEGYQFSDLRFSSSNLNTASVDKIGNIKAIESGNAVIRIYTSDGAHSIQCSVLVRDKEKS